MKPSDFNESLQQRLKRVQISKNDEQEIEIEKRLLNNANFFLDNYKILSEQDNQMQ